MSPKAKHTNKPLSRSIRTSLRTLTDSDFDITKGPYYRINGGSRIIYSLSIDAENDPAATRTKIRPHSRTDFFYTGQYIRFFE